MRALSLASPSTNLYFLTLWESDSSDPNINMILQTHLRPKAKLAYAKAELL